VDKDDRSLLKHMNQYNLDNEKGKIHDFEFVTRDTINFLYGAYYIVNYEIPMSLAVGFTCGIKSHLKELKKSFPEMKVPNNIDHLYPWVHSDPDTHPLLLGLVKRKDFILDNNMRKRFRFMFEAGLNDIINMLIEKQPDRMMLLKDLFLPDLEPQPEKMKDCLYYSKNLKIKEVGFIDFKLNNIIRLMGCFLLLNLISFIVLVIELCVKHIL